MTKQEYLSALTSELGSIAEGEKKEIIADYNDHFDAGLKKGRTESEIAEQLGDPKKIAKEWKFERLVQKAQGDMSVNNVSQAVVAAIGLSIFNLLFILGPYLGIAGVIFALLTVGLSLIFAGVLALILIAASPFIPGVEVGVPVVAAVLISIGIISLGAIWTIISGYITRFFLLFTVKYLKWNLSVIKK